MSKHRSILDLTNDLSAASAQALAIAEGFSCADSLEELSGNTLSHIFWGLSDYLKKIEQLNNNMWEQYKKESRMIPAENRTRAFEEFSDLPFVNHNGPSENWSNWSVPPADDYGEACEAGNYYGACFLQFQLSEPEPVGENVIGVIAKDIDFKDNSAAKGYWVGFFGFIETFSYWGAMHGSVWAFFDRQNEGYRKIQAESEAESN